MTDNKNLIKFTIFIILLFQLISFTNASNVYVTPLNVTTRGIDYDSNNNLYLTCIDNECDNYGVNVSILKYNLNTNTANRFDNLVSSNLPMTKSILGDNAKNSALKHFNVQKGVGNPETLTYLYSQYYTTYPNEILNINVYRYDYVNNRFYLLGTNTYLNPTGFTNSCKPNGRFFAQINNAYSSNNNSYFDFSHVLADLNTYYCGFVPNVIKKGLYNVSNSNIVTFRNTEYLLNSLDDNPLSEYYTTQHRYNSYDGVTLNNITANGTFGSTLESDDLIITSDSTNVFLANLTALYLNNDTMKNVASFSSSCNSIFSVSHVIDDITCKSKSDCLFVGSKNNASMLIAFDGVECKDVDLSNDFNVTNRELYSVKYNKIDDSYYITGKNILLHYTSLGATTTIPLCISSNQLCNNPLFYNGDWLCDINDIKYCSESCINLIVDSTTNNYYTQTFKTCNSTYSTQQRLTGITSKCNTLDYTWWQEVLPLVIPPFAYIYTPFGGCTVNFTSSSYVLPYSTCDSEPLNQVYAQNQNHTFISQGICSESTICTNDCNIIGYQECTDMTSFKVCGRGGIYGTDNCLHYATGFGCQQGTVCSNGYCVSNTGSGLSNNNYFTVTPYSVNSNTTSYNVNANTKTVSVSTTNLVQVQGFAISTASTSSYSSRTCDYTESSIYSDSTITYINSTKTISLPMTGISSYIKLSVLPSNLINTTIQVTDSLSNQLFNITFNRNTSSKSVCEYLNDVLIYCSYSVNTYDDLSSVDINAILEFQSHTYTVTTTFNRQQDYIITTQPQAFTTSEFSNINIISTNSTYLNSNISTFTQPIGFSVTEKNNYQYLTCVYSQNKCYIARTYNNNNGISDFSNYQDYTVCTTFGTTGVTGNTQFDYNQQSFIDSLFGTNLSTAEKLFDALMWIVIVSLLMLVFGFSFGMSGVMVGALTVIADLIVLIFMSFIGFIPVWIIIMIGIFTAGVVAMFMKNVVTQ